jgi:hypothetical protein
MKCCTCPDGAEGYAVIPGIGEAGEIRFFCDRCARTHRVKMRYWDGRDLDVGGHRDNPDLGASFQTLILAFQDVARMRREDLLAVVGWLEDEELALALVGTDTRLAQKLYSVLPLERVRRIRDLLESPNLKGTGGAPTPEAARKLVVDVIWRL